MMGWGHGGIRAGYSALLAGALIAGVPGIMATGASADITAPSAPTSNAPSGPVAASQASASGIKVGPNAFNFGLRRAGTVSFTATAAVKNVSGSTVTISNIRFSRGNAADFVVGTTCFPDGKPRTLEPGEQCYFQVRFVPRKEGVRQVKVLVESDAKGSPATLALTGTGTMGYYLAGSAGGIATFGDAVFRGERRNFPLAAPVISMSATRGGSGYWLLGSDGGVFSYGYARFYGSTGAMQLNQPVVSMASIPNGYGYWLVASDGGVFSFGKAKFHGSTGGIRLNQPIVGMASTRTGKGYWLLAADGGIFSFGDAKFYGSSASANPDQRASAMAITPTGKGYWILLANGGVYSFGDATPLGSAASRSRGGSFVGIAPTPNGRGYWLSNSVGQVFNFGEAPYYGDLYRRRIANAVGVVATAPPISPLRFDTNLRVINAASAGQLKARVAAEANRRVKLP